MRSKPDALRRLAGCIGVAVGLFLALLLLVGPASAGARPTAPRDVTGEILAQDLTAGQGYTVLHVWGTHYEMGCAHGHLLADYIQMAYEEVFSLFAPSWPQIRSIVSQWTCLPTACEDEFAGMLEGVRTWYPETDMDLLDMKVLCTFGDWFYGIACRSTCCWDELVEPPYTTLAARKLQFITMPPEFTQQWHHVICAWDPSDGGVPWVNVAFPGYVSTVTGVNSHGTIASLHDWNSNIGPLHADALPRTMACRYALTMDLDPDPSTHLQTVFDELNSYDCATGGFINYYVPDGGAGVIKSSRSLGYYDARVPQIEWMDGHVVSTNNSDIDGKSGITPWVDYYESLDPGGGILATMEGLWSEAYQPGDYHIAQVGFRGEEDMTLWFTGRLQSSMLARLEMEWDELFAPAGDVDTWPQSIALAPFPNPAHGDHAVTLPFRMSDGEFLPVGIYDLSGRQVRLLLPSAPAATGELVLYRWDGRDAFGRIVPAGVYLYGRSPRRDPLTRRIVWLGP